MKRKSTIKTIIDQANAEELREQLKTFEEEQTSETIKKLEDQGKWIMLTTKLPTVVSPPKLSIFWSVLWPMDEAAKAFKARKETGKRFSFNRADPLEAWGIEPDYVNARKIYYKGENIRVFPHEFTELTAKNMNVYIDSGVHELVPDTIAEGTLLTNTVLNKDNRPLYDIAKNCGASETQAILMALGKEPSYEESDFPPPIGWYKCTPEYASVFCYEREMEG